MIKEGLLNADGQFVQGAAFDALVEAWVPSNLKDLLIPRFTECRDNSGKLII